MDHKEVILDGNSILTRYPEKRSARQFILIELTVTQAAQMIEDGWDVDCLTPGSVIRNGMQPKVIEDYVLYIEAAISPFWDRYADVTRWVIPEVIKHGLKAKMTLDQRDNSEYPYLMSIDEPDAEAQLRRKVKGDG